MPRVYNTETHEIIDIDRRPARLSRLRRRVKNWCNVLADYFADCKRFRLIMITLTYRGVNDWQPYHIRRFMRCVRTHCRDGLLGYVWVAELQKRGAPHYHVLLLVRRGTDLPMPDRAGWWPHGHTRIETARSRFYILKYVSKKKFQIGDEWKDFPKGMRLFCVWLSAELLSPEDRHLFRLSALPAWLEKELKQRDRIVRVRRLTGGGWLISDVAGPQVNEVIRSPYRVLSY